MNGRLVLTRRPLESVVINEEVKVTLIARKDGNFQLVFEEIVPRAGEKYTYRREEIQPLLPHPEAINVPRPRHGILRSHS